LNNFDSLGKTFTWIVVGLIAIGVYLFFDKRRTDSYNKFVIEGWCDCILRGMYLNDDGMPEFIQKRNVKYASQYFESLGAKTLIDVSENSLVVSHRGRQHKLSITDV